MKRTLSLILSAVLVLLLLPVPGAQAAISSSTYSVRAQAFINDSRWAHGASWGSSHKQTYEVSEWSSSGCCAYCADFAGYVYGAKRAWNEPEFTKYSDPNAIGPGDIVHFKYSNPKRTSEHWIVVLDRDGESLYTAEGNAYVDGNYSRVCITDTKWAVKNGQLVNRWNSTERCYDLECYRYNFSDGGTGSMDTAVCDHKSTKTVGKKAATCTEEGNTGATVCADCTKVLKDGQSIPMLAHSWAGEKCSVCGTRASDVYRLGGETRFDTAINVADQLKASLGVEKFDNIIIASGSGFADALAGSYLASVLNAPILLSYVEGGPINEKVAFYIRQNLKEDGLVYILGGYGAVPEEMESMLEGFYVRRLAGEDRFATNLEILMEAGVGMGPILVCTGTSFADSLSASAAGLPILLVWKELTEQQRAFLESAGSGEFYIIGGEAAVSGSLMTQLESYGKAERIAGETRFDTSVRIAEKFFPEAKSGVLAYAWNYPDGLCGGALAAAMKAPLILTMDGYGGAAKDFVRKTGMSSGFVLGSRNLVSDKTVIDIFNLGDGLGIREK